MPSFKNIKQDALAQLIGSLSDRYTATSNQLLTELDESKRSVLKKTLENLETEIKEAETQLANTELNEDKKKHRKETRKQSQKERRRSTRKDWKMYLPRLNFKEVVDITQELLLQKSGNSAALFLIPNNRLMGGEWCVKRIRELLEEETSDLRWIEIERSGTRQFSDRMILDTLGKELNVKDLPGDSRRAAQKLIRKVRQSVRSGSVRVFEIRGWEFIHDFSEILTWFVRDFWIPLTQQLIEIESQYRRVRFVAIVTADEPLREDALPAAMLCTRAEFQIEKILELPLPNWSQQEIEEWLETYLRLSTEEIIRLGSKLYRHSNSGLPLLVHDALARHLQN